MDSPVQKIIEWYNSLPSPHKIEIAGQLLLHLPGFKNNNAFEEDTNLIIADFLDPLERSRKTIQSEVAMVLLLRETIQLFFINGRGNSNNWREINENLVKTNSSYRKLEAEENNFSEKQWKVTCEKWVNISDFLLNTYLEKYLQS